VVLSLLALFLLYLYMLHLHLNGRMIDLFRRLHGDDTRFLLPHDFEVSAAELAWIVAKAGRWRGAKGDTRKVAVCDYVLTDPLDARFKETTSHLIIYHAGLDGKRELYRHFLRLPDGSIVEVFGSMERAFGAGLGAFASGGAAGVAGSALHDILMQHATDNEAQVASFFAGLE
jgi:hypothetical protein